MQALGYMPPLMPAELLLPRVPLDTWSVIACDQYTSEPEYWERVEAKVGDRPSALRLILPEQKLGRADTAAEIKAIHAAMEDYLQQDLFYRFPESYFYIERRLSSGGLRQGVVGVIDLELYDFRADAKTEIRATEQTVLSRIPPRAEIRRGAALDMSHVMLLLDDPYKTAIEPMSAQTDEMELLYHCNLMERGGQVSAWRLGELQMENFISALTNLDCRNHLRIVVGDGNHSLAAAKAVYEEKKGTPEGEACRYALAELVNLHEDSLRFEPIHRICYGVNPQELRSALLSSLPGAYIGAGEGQQFTMITGREELTITVPDPPQALAVGTLQSFLDDYLPGVGGQIDYIHGSDVLRRLCEQPDTLGFLLPAMDKSELFPAIQKGGSLPRKTFSMGEAQDKRFYMETRALR